MIVNDNLHLKINKSKLLTQLLCDNKNKKNSQQIKQEYWIALYVSFGFLLL